MCQARTKCFTGIKFSKSSQQPYKMDILLPFYRKGTADKWQGQNLNPILFGSKVLTCTQSSFITCIVINQQLGKGG